MFRLMPTFWTSTHKPVVHGLFALDVEFEALGIGEAAVGLQDFAFPFLDGGLNVVDLELDGLPGVLQLVAVLAAEDLQQLLAAFDIGIQFGDFGVFRPEIAAEFRALDLKELDLFEGGLAFRGRAGGGGRTHAGCGVNPGQARVGGAGRGRPVKGGGLEEAVLELKVGQLGFQGGQVAPRDRAFLLQNGEVVGALEGHQGILFAL